MEDHGQKPEAQEDSFESLEKEFQDVLNELMEDKDHDKFRVGYEKLTNALKKSHENEKRLMTKCRELNAEIVSSSVKVDTALKLSQEDQTTITSLKMELEKAWKMVGTAHDKELKSKETIQTLKQDISNLNKLIEQGAGLSIGEEHSVSDLMKIKDELTKERDDLLTEAATLRKNRTMATSSQEDMEIEKQKAMETISQLQKDIQVHQNECSRETRQKEKLEKDVKQLHFDMEAKQSEIKVLSTQIQRSKDEQQRLEQQLREQKIFSKRATKELEQLQVRNTKLQQENEQTALSNEQVYLDNQEKASELKLKEEEVNKMRQEIAKLTKTREATQRKFRQMEDQKFEVEQQKDMLTSQIAGLEREMESSKKQMEIDKKAIEELVRERDILNKNMIKATSATEKQRTVVKLHEQSKKHLEQEIINYRDEAQKQRKIIYQLEKERDHYINQASELAHKVVQHMEDMKVTETQIFDYKKKIAEAETKLKQQQNVYEAVRSDRNLYSKNLIEAQDEITEMNRKLKIMNLQTDQLKEEINGKESALATVQSKLQRVEKDESALMAELQKMKQQAQETKLFIGNQEAEERKLRKIIDDADVEQLRQKKELNQVINERDVLGTQLVRRNDELALLYEKIQIQQSILNKGEIQYNQRVEDIRILKLEIKKLRREKGILGKTVANVEELRGEVYHMQWELLKERSRYKALEEETQNPMNVHRWRRIKATDPSTYELIQKINALQKRLITKSKEVVEKELLLQEKEKLYVELKHILARHPGPEAAEQLQKHQHTIRQKTKQLKVMRKINRIIERLRVSSEIKRIGGSRDLHTSEMKALSAELHMHESNTQEYKSEIERLAHELKNVKMKYLNQKHKEQQDRAKERSLAQVELSEILPQRSDGPRFTGGGFNLKQAGKIAT